MQSFIAASAEPVWGALHSRTDVLFDGLPAKSWPQGGDEQPPFHLESPWPFTPSPTDVSITLHELGGGVRVDVRHAGWGNGPQWDEAIQGHFAGWLHGLSALGLLIESGLDARASNAGERYLISGEIPADPGAVFRSLTDESVRAKWSNGALDGLAIAEQLEDMFVRWKGAGVAGGSGREVTAILRVTPRGTHLALAEYGVRDRGASGRWPAFFEGLARFLS